MESKAPPSDADNQPVPPPPQHRGPLLNMEPSMTQDCVEWDESNNSDLRKIASPQFRTPGEKDDTPSTANLTRVRTSTSSSSSSSQGAATTRPVAAAAATARLRRSLGDVSRCLPVNSTEKAAAASSSAAEQEIEGIFRRLGQRRNSSLGGSSIGDPALAGTAAARGAATTATTHQHQNKHLFQQGPTLQLAHRKRRRREQQQPAPSTTAPPSLKQQVQTPHHAGLTGLQQQPTESSALPAVFQDLMKELSTPSPPAAAASGQEMPPPRSRRSSASSSSLPNDNHNVDNGSLPPQQQQQQPEYAPDSSLHTATTAASNVPSSSSFMGPSAAPTTTNSKVLPAAPVVAVAKTNLTMAASTTTTTTAAKEKDEFGDFDFSMDELAVVDSMVLAATQQQPTNNSSESAVSSITTAAAAVSNVPAPAVSNPSVVTTAAATVNVQQQDAFDDDWMNVDFEALDRSIADHVSQRLQQGASPFGPNAAGVASTAASNLVPPPEEAPVRNPRATPTAGDLSFLSFTRYKVLSVDATYARTRTLSVAVWKPDMLQEDQSHRALHRRETMGKALDRNQTGKSAWPVDGALHLRGEWYHTRVEPGDIIHLCSLRGQFRTDAAALPLVLHTTPPAGSDTDDLVLIVHPDRLLTPTGISETHDCTRRAVLKSRLGSSGLSSEAALFGTMRHELFEETLKENDFSTQTAQQHIADIVRRNAEGLLSCGVSSMKAEVEMMKFVPQLQRFARDFTSLSPEQRVDKGALVENRYGAQPSFRFVADSVDAVEEPVISPELGLKGNVDVIAKATTVRDQQPATSSLMSIELKTGHFQKTHHAHEIQLSLYMLMLQLRCGTKRETNGEAFAAADSGLLLYMNNENVRAVDIVPRLGEIKTLIGHRNVLASEMIRVSRPRGIQLSYEDSNNSDSSDQCSRVSVTDAPPAALPDVLPNPHKCKNCYANRECMMYAGAERSLLPESAMDSVGTSHKELLQQFTGHLASEDFAYFQKWDRLVDFEADATFSSPSEAWLVSSEDRERTTSKCISQLIFDQVDDSSTSDADDNRLVILSFRRSPDASLRTAIGDLSVEPGSYAIVSTDSTSLGVRTDCRPHNSIRPQMQIVRGVMERVTDTHAFIRASHSDFTRVRRLLSAAKSSERAVLFRIDRDDVSTGSGTLRQNLVNFFRNDLCGDDSTSSGRPRRLAWLRDAVVRLRTPVFDLSLIEAMFTSVPVQGGMSPVPGCDMRELFSEFSALNDDQRAAVEKVVTAQDYSLIQGLPGTGKTSTISFVARLLAARGKRVLITSYTHSAVDNVLLKLTEKGVAALGANRPTPALVRVGRYSSCHPGIQPLLADRIAAGLDADSIPGGQPILPSAETLRQVVSSARIVGVTALSVPRSPLLVGEHFDVVIVDEAGQISQPAIIGALMAADSFVLVGDHKQLPPLVSSELAERGGFGESLLMRLAEKHSFAVAQLTLQYRMHEDICQLSNDIVYKGRLQCANEEVRRKTLDLPGFPENVPSLIPKVSTEWLTRAVDPVAPVVFVDTDKVKTDGSTDAIEKLERASGDRGGGGGVVNDTEAGVVRFVVDSLIRCGLEASSIGVICPFRAQLRLLNDCEPLKKLKTEGLEMSTIDRYQGRDKPAIILSFVRSNVKGRVGRLLEDFRRLNVAITRAKCKLIMVGSFSTLHRGSDALRPVLDRVRKEDRVIELPKYTAQILQ